MAAIPDARHGRSLSRVPVSAWIAIGLLGFFVVCLLTIGPRRDSDNRHAFASETRAVSPDGSLQLHYPLADQRFLREGALITFRTHPIGRVVEVDPGQDAILVKMLFRRDLVGKVNAAPAGLRLYHPSSDPTVTWLALVRH